MIHPLTFRDEIVDGEVFYRMPCIDGTPLAKLVAESERRAGYQDPAGGYGGIEASLSTLRSVLADRVVSRRRIHVLACACGEVGCWPLVADMELTDDTVIWTAFRQPHRLKRDYRDFGPFRFRQDHYEQCLAAATFDRKD